MIDLIVQILFGVAALCVCLAAMCSPPEVSRGPLILVLVLIAVCALSGCAPTRTLITPERVEIPVYIRAPLSPELLREYRYPRPEPACVLDTGEPTYCNGQLVTMLQDAAHALDQANTDKRAIKAAQERTP